MTRSVMYADNSDPSASIDSTCRALSMSNAVYTRVGAPASLGRV